LSGRDEVRVLKQKKALEYQEIQSALQQQIQEKKRRLQQQDSIKAAKQDSFD
jgi:hypothetical protein